MHFIKRIFSNRKTDVCLALMLIVILAFGLRIYRLTQDPRGFFCDEASFGYNALTISQNLRDEYGSFLPLYFEAFGDYKSSLPIYLAVPIIKTLGLSVLSVRVIGAVFGTLTVLVLYFLAQKIFQNKKAALLTSFLLAISPWHLQFSRSGLWDIAIFPLFFLLSLYLTLVSNERKKLLPVAFLAWGLTVYTYNVARIIVPIFVLGILLLFIKKAKLDWKNATVSMFIFVLVALPSFLILLGPGANRWNQVSIFAIKEDSGAKIVRLANNFLSHYSLDFLFAKGENSFITRHAVMGMGELYLWQLPFVVIGLIGLIRQRGLPRVPLLLSLIVYPIGAALSDRSPSASRAILGAVIFPIITTNGLFLTKDFLTRRTVWLKGFGRWFLAGLFSIVVAISLIWYLVLYYRFYPLQSSDYWGWQYGAQEIVSYFKSHQADYDELIMSSQFNEPGYFLKFFEPQTPCANCLIGNLESINPNKKQLFALASNEITDDLKGSIKIKRRVLYSDGRSAFVVFEP